MLNVSQATISRLVKANDIEPVKGDGKTKKYNRTQFKKLDVLLNAKRVKVVSGSNNDDQLVKELRKEIEDLKADKKAQRKQIDDLSEQLKMAQINLNQSQQLQLKQAEKITQLEAPKDQKESTEDNQDIQKKPESTKKPTSRDVSEEMKTKKKDKWWRRIFS